MEKKELQQTIKKLRKDLVEIKEKTSIREQAIEKAKLQSEERVANLLKKQPNEMEIACREYEAKEKEMVREEIRKQIEEKPLFGSKIRRTIEQMFGYR